MGGRLRAAALLLVLACTAGIAQAQADRPAGREHGLDLIELSADAQREVANDTLTAEFSVESSNTDAAQVANALNGAINDALKTAAGYKTVRARSGNSQTYPVYDRNQHLTGWRGRADLRIDTRDFTAGSALIAKLQSSLQLGGMSFSVSPEARRSAENDLIADAVAAFKTRAEAIRAAVGAKGYRIRHMSFNTGGAVSPRPLFAMRSLAQASVSVAPPQLEGGLSEVSVSVAGAIEANY